MHVLLLYILAAVVVAAIPTLLCVRRVMKGRMPGWMGWLATWAAWGFGFALPMLIFARLSFFSRLAASAAIFFGPWATQVARIGSFPNAGEFFSLRWAVIGTFILGSSFATAVLSAKPNVKVASLLVSVLADIAWFGYGWLQLLNCSE